jgi:hypothetical protein
MLRPDAGYPFCLLAAGLESLRLSKKSFVQTAANPKY